MKLYILGPNVTCSVSDAIKVTLRAAFQSAAENRRFEVIENPPILTVMAKDGIAMIAPFMLECPGCSDMYVEGYRMTVPRTKIPTEIKEVWRLYRDLNSSMDDILFSLEGANPLVKSWFSLWLPPEIRAKAHKSCS